MAGLIAGYAQIVRFLSLADLGLRGCRIFVVSLFVDDAATILFLCLFVRAPLFCELVMRAFVLVVQRNVVLGFSRIPVGCFDILILLDRNFSCH